MTPNFEQTLAQALNQHRNGRPDLAEPVYRKLIEENPENADIHHLLAIIELSKKHYEEAEVLAAKAIERNTGEAKYFNTLGAILRGQGRNQEAEAAYLKALEIDSGFVDARHNLGEVLRAQGRTVEAEKCFRVILDGQPDNIGALNNLATLQMDNNDYGSALAPLRKAAGLSPENGLILKNLLNCLERMNQLEEASEVIFRLEASDPENAEGQLIAARVERRTGRQEQAANRLRALLKKTEGADLRVHALFELGLVLDRTGQPEEAFAVFNEGNALKNKELPSLKVDPVRYSSRVARDRKWFTAERLGTWEDSQNEDAPAPIFFVGFPRSGTTLFEQVLNAHPDIITTGEVSPLERLRNHLHREGRYPENLGVAAKGDIRKWQQLFEGYCHDILGDELDGRFMVDKMPLNIADLGLINRLLPKARIITALRDPRDVCLSNFMQNFRASDSMSNFNDIESTARLYVQVMEFWQHCRRHMSLPWIEFRYEDLVADFESCTRRILDFIGIPWSDEIYRYRDAARSRPITTPSYRDVVNPMYSHASGRWRAYRRQLEPILEELQPFVRDFGYKE